MPRRSWRSVPVSCAVPPMWRRRDTVTMAASERVAEETLELVVATALGDWSRRKKGREWEERRGSDGRGGASSSSKRENRCVCKFWLLRTWDDVGGHRASGRAALRPPFPFPPRFVRLPVPLGMLRRGGDHLPRGRAVPHSVHARTGWRKRRRPACVERQGDTLLSRTTSGRTLRGLPILDPIRDDNGVQFPSGRKTKSFPTTEGDLIRDARRPVTYSLY